MTLRRGLFVALLVVAWVPSTSLAQCVIFDKPDELYGLSDVVFRGKAVAQQPTGIEGSHVTVAIATFQVDQVWKGHPGRQVAVGTDVPFEIGKEYLVFAGGKPLATSSLCRGAELLDHAKGKLDWLSKNVRLPQELIEITTTAHRRSHETSHWYRRHFFQGQGRSSFAGVVQAAPGSRCPTLVRSCLRLD